MLDEIGAGEMPRLLVLNKIDRCDELDAPAAAQPPPRRRAGLGAHGRGDPRRLSSAIGEHFAGRFERVELLVPFDQGGVLAELYALGSPIEREDTAEGVRIRAHLPHALAERYAAFRLVPTGA